MTPTRFKKIGRLLFGFGWQAAMGKALGVHYKQVNRWAAGEYDVPAEIEKNITKLVMDRRAQLLEVL